MIRLLVVALLLSAPAAARTWQVAPDAELKAPSDAARLVDDGDTVIIAPGEYYDCAVWNASRLTVQAAGPGVVLTDSTCQGKAIFVVNGSDVTIIGLTFARARVPDGNGGGIRAQGGNLTIRDSRFVNNQIGILAADNPTATLTITGSRFEANGACAAARCVPSLMVGALAALRIDGSSFTAARAGSLVQSGAASTEIRSSLLEDGPQGRSALLVDLRAPGHVLLDRNTLQKGPNSTEPGVAIALGRGAEGGEVRVQGNSLRNDTGGRVTLVRDWSAETPILTANTLAPGDTEISSSGVLRNRASIAAHGLLDTARSTAGQLKRTVRSWLAD